MMTVDVLTSDISVMQPILDETFGPGVFTIDRIYDPILEWKNYFLTYEDSVPQSTVDQAVKIVNDYHNEALGNKKVRWYEKMQMLVDNKIAELATNKYSDKDIADSEYWLNNQSSQVPSCVMFVALKQNLSNQAAAQFIIDSKTNYDLLVAQLNSIQTSFQNELMTSDLRQLKILTTNTMEQVNNFPN